MLTVVQTMEIATQSSSPPWHVADLLPIFQGTPAVGPSGMSLRAVVSRLSAQDATFFVQVRDPAIFPLLATFSPAELREAFLVNWPTSPSKSTLQGLSAAVDRSGAAIVYVSRDWRTVGIRGSIEQLAGVSTGPPQTLELEPGVPASKQTLDAVQKLAEEVALAAAALVIVATLPADAAVVVVGAALIGAAAAGFALGWSIGQLIYGPPASIASPAAVYGEPPTNF